MQLSGVTTRYPLENDGKNVTNALLNADRIKMGVYAIVLYIVEIENCFLYYIYKSYSLQGLNSFKQSCNASVPSVRSTKKKRSECENCKWCPLTHTPTHTQRERGRESE